MSEDVDEQLAPGLDPGRYLVKKILVIFHVLKHLNRNDPIKAGNELFIFKLGNIP